MSDKVHIVSPEGHLVEASRTVRDAVAAGSKPDLKPGWRYATHADHDAKAKAEAERQKSEKAK
jgi:hypothetical protein